MRVANKERSKRRSIMMSDSLVAEMAELREKMSAQSDSEVIRRALRLLKRLTNDPDLEIVVTDPKTGKAVQLLIV